MASAHHDPDRAEVSFSLSIQNLGGCRGAWHLQVGQLKFGMQTMSQSLVDLHQRRLIYYEEAVGHATEPDERRAKLGALPPTSRH